jgi:hypothetical protein
MRQQKIQILFAHIQKTKIIRTIILNTCNNLINLTINQIA